jgi:asparagine synthase (glutamine-hydrolysing)
MVSDCGRFIIIYNGEIYNHNLLKNKYLSNHKFKTYSDTEVILKLFILFGQDSFSLLSGMFAIAIWDSRKSKLFLARDRSGIKPLFYSINKSILYFSSSSKIISDIFNDKKLNINSLNCFIRFGYIFGDETLYDNVKFFPSGKYAIYENNEMKFYSFKDYKSESKYTSLIELNNEEIKKHLVADCTIGVFLSGGIDSSIVAYHASHHINKINTYSVGFNGKNINDKFNLDISNAKKFSSYINSNHHEVIINSNDLIELFMMSTESMSLPISNPTALTLFKLSQYARNTSKVILTGDGNDELFYGYDRYRKIYNNRFLLNNFLIKSLIQIRHNKNKIDKKFDLFYRFHANKDKTIHSLLVGDWFNESYVASLINSNLDINSNKISLDKLIEYDSKFWLQNFSLLLSDNITMKNNLELRVPLLSDELIYFSQKLPVNMKLNRHFGKVLHRNSYKNILPEYIFMPKKGFMSPASDWIRDENFKLWLTDLILKPNYIFDSMFNKNNILKMYDDHVLRKKYNLNILWAIFTLKYWLDINNFNDFCSNE